MLSPELGEHQGEACAVPRPCVYNRSVQECHCLPLPWCDPVAVLSGSSDEPQAALLSDGSDEGRWSYLAGAPAETFGSAADLAAALARWAAPAAGEGPPFRGGAIGLASYEWGASLERAAPQVRTASWPDLAGGFHDRVIGFDHHERRVWAVGRGVTAASARARAEEMAAWLAVARLEAARPLPAADFTEIGTGAAYQVAVADVIEAVRSGEIFQANIARRWQGRLGAGVTPLDLFAALARGSPAPFAGYLRLSGLAPGLAVVSNSPERFLQVTAAGSVRTQPIKGTRPRGRTPAKDQVLAAALQASEKDRAENLMIVDLMRNDLARACTAGSVRVPALYALRSFANVHHLVSTVVGQLAPGRTALDLFGGAFPPGSITGAPKLQAMTVIARHEPPRGPYCGSLFWAGCDGAFDSSVLIRTLALIETAPGVWAFETRAGAAVTAGSVPEEEEEETTAKIDAIRRALVGA